MASILPITTRRFLLRDFTEADGEAFVRYHADPRHLALYGAAEAAASHIGSLLATFAAWAAEEPRENYQLAIVRRGPPGATVGCCGLRTKGCAPGVAELGIELAPITWGRHGYAIEIMDALLDFGFDQLRLQEIRGGTPNVRAARLAAYFGGVEVEAPIQPDGTPKAGGQTHWLIVPQAYKDSRGRKGRSAA